MRPWRAQEVLGFRDVLGGWLDALHDPEDPVAVAELLRELANSQDHEGRPGEAFRTAGSFLGVQIMSREDRLRQARRRYPELGTDMLLAVVARIEADALRKLARKLRGVKVIRRNTPRRR